MHIPDGFLSPAVSVAAAGGSLAIGWWAVRRTERTLEDKRIPALGVTAAFIFAAQMINVPIAAGTSGHIMGAALAAATLGPAAGFVVMGVVLTIQALFFADGGLTALGANLFNMGVVGVGTATLLFTLARRVVPPTVAVGVGAAGSVMAASIACAVELALSGTAPLGVVLPTILSIHTLIGLAEGIVTAAALSTVMTVRPDIVAFAPEAAR
jgi:cobalt/nickel transport system permease protein